MTGATEIVLLRNLLAIIAMIDGDRTDATKHFTLAAAVPGGEPAGYGLLLLNQAFFAIADKRPEEARRLFQDGEKAVQSVVSPGFHGRIMVLKGLVAWANGDKTEAEQLFRHAVAKAYDDDEAHRYTMTTRRIVTLPFCWPNTAPRQRRRSIARSPKWPVGPTSTSRAWPTPS